MHAGTVHGALVSIVAAILAVLLIVREWQYSMHAHTAATLQVENRFNPAGTRLNVTFDIEFPHILCDHMSISAEDTSGTHFKWILKH
jgi:Endoplasmic Reticulum-Golgi Intermediate Compartment (ERGIC)